MSPVTRMVAAIVRPLTSISVRDGSLNIKRAAEVCSVKDPDGSNFHHRSGRYLARNRNRLVEVLPLQSRSNPKRSFGLGKSSVGNDKLPEPSEAKRRGAHSWLKSVAAAKRAPFFSPNLLFDHYLRGRGLVGARTFPSSSIDEN